MCRVVSACEVQFFLRSLPAVKSSTFSCDALLLKTMEGPAQTIVNRLRDNYTSQVYAEFSSVLIIFDMLLSELELGHLLINDDIKYLSGILK